ncbi:RAD51-associated protein 1 [Sphaerodactylus townsendi]|uniref:Uncharacterized protein n=1 Tax=Sphaerodactylus townsendi TaxID=933632 RepID=A0ACB8EAV2_9SAUR|nr:RAD51-associated protein 1 [Sphaerodactylus townsendi]
MTRRSKKAVDYSQFGDGDDSDDEDFTSIAAPSHKKSKRETKKKKEPQNKLPKEEVQLQKRAPNKRVALDDKLYHRDLEVALALAVNEPALGTCKVKDSQEQVLHESANRRDGTVKDSQQRTAASQQKPLSESQGSGSSAHSYEPEAISTEESKANSSFSEDSDDEFLEKATKENGKRGKMLSAQSEQAKTTSKLKTSSVVQAKPQPTLKRDPRSSEPMGKPLKTSSPTAPKRPSWKPPAASGRSNNPLGGVLVKSPTQSLRLGLSRLARVKPLHPSVTSI